MLDVDLLNKGTIYWKRRSENTFNVIPGSSILLGLFDPNLSVQTYGYDRERMDLFVAKLAETFGYEGRLLVNPSVRFEHMYDELSEMTFIVGSQTADRTYKVTLRNVAKKQDNVESKLKSLRNLKHMCGCGRGYETDILCSMPREACRTWGISDDEYTKGLFEKDKIYGEKICKHEARALTLLGYPLFNKAEFHREVLPAVIKELGTKDILNQEIINVVVRNNLSRVGWFDVLSYFRWLHESEECLERVQKRLS